MKTARIMVVIFALTITLVGCKVSKADIYQRINKIYMEPASYTAKCSAKVIGNKTENTYEFEVSYQSPDSIKMSFLPNNVEILINSDKASLNNKLIGHTIHLNSESGDYPNFIINTFFKNYFMGETSSAEVSAFPKGEHTILECEISEGNDYAYKQRLCIDNDTCFPVSLKTLNSKGDVVIDVEFLEFLFSDKTYNAY